MYMSNAIFRGSPDVLLIIIPVVCLFCWLFNAYRLRKLKKAKPDAWDKQKSDRIALWIIGGFIIVTALALAALRPFFA